MKLVFIIGDAAVGKMTVGQELMKITDLRLFHNHMTIEPVIEIFGRYDGKTIAEMRDLIFKNFAASENYGMIFTMMMDFDMPSEWEYLAHIKNIFEPYGTEFYYVELIAPQEIRLERNVSENRLKNKASKRDIESSNRRLLDDDSGNNGKNGNDDVIQWQPSGAENQRTDDSRYRGQSRADVGNNFTKTRYDPQKQSPAQPQNKIYQKCDQTYIKHQF